MENKEKGKEDVKDSSLSKEPSLGKKLREENEETSERKEDVKEERIRSITSLYYSRQDVRKAIYEFSKNREVVPRYFEGFGKRPDALQYDSDILAFVKKGATSFHCSEEIWKDALQLSTELSEHELANLREGWDLLIDIDSKYLDYSKISAQLLIQALEFHGVRNIGVKFSVSGDTDILVRNDDNIQLIRIDKAIRLIKEGTNLEVLSLDNNKKLKFSKVYSYLEHEDFLYEILHSQSKIPLKATEHHSVFVWDKGEVTQKKVSELKKGDFLISFNSRENPFVKMNDFVSNNFEFSENQFTKRIIDKKVEITPDLMRLIGYFLAEGHTTKIINQTGFSFNRNEAEYIEDCKNLLSKITNRKISIRHPNPNSTQILIHSKEWHDFFRNICGEKKEKHVPKFSWNLSNSLFLELLKGYLRGDAYKLDEYGIVVKSVSKKLIKELIWLCKLNSISCSLSSEQNKPHKLPKGNYFKGSFVYILKIPKSELSMLEFNRSRNKFSPYPRDKVFPIDGLKIAYRKIKPGMFNCHRAEQMTLKKKRANLNRIKKVLDWFSEYKTIKEDADCKKIIENYNSLFNSDISVAEVREVTKKHREKVYDVSVEETESFFGNDYPILLHNSGSKGFHIIVPWNAFPKEIYGNETSKMFPEWPRLICQYLNELIKKQLIEKISDLMQKDRKIYVKDFESAEQVMPDIVLVSPRHLFRMPYSLHEKNSLASVVIDKNKVQEFQVKDANPLKVQVKDFCPEAEEEEARELLLQAIDWGKAREQTEEKEKNKGKKDFKEIIIKDLTPELFPPCISSILNGIKQDGRKRALFILLNFLKSLKFDNEEIEKKIEEWNKKNYKPLKEGYIRSQLSWYNKQKSMLPPNCDKPHYKDLAVCKPDNFCKFVKNPVNYTIKKSFLYKRNLGKKGAGK